MKKKKALKKIRRHFVYMLRCTNGTYYTGYTINVEKRIALHNKGRGAKYLRGKLPVELVFTKKFNDYKKALIEERNIKKKTRQQKEKLIKLFQRKTKKLILP